MKKLVSILLCALTLPFLLIGCNNTPTATNTPGATTLVPTSEPTPDIDEANAIFVDGENGNDENDGKRATPVKTIGQALKLAKPGNTVYICNGTYYGSVKMPSGEAGKPITLAAMPGHRPVLSPTIPYLGAWEKYNGNIYVADMSAIADEIDAARIQLFADGDALVEARYPNMEPSMSKIMDYKRAVAQQGTSTTQIVAPEELPADIVGATLIIWPGEEGASAWTSLSAPVAAVDGKTITLAHEIGEEEQYTGLNAYKPYKGNAFYIVGALSLLDAPGEYYYDAQTSKMYVYMPKGDDPSAYNISVRGSSKAINASNCEYVVLRGLNIFGGGIYMKNANNCRIEECSVRYADHMNVTGHASYTHENSMLVTGDNNYITKCEFGPTAFSGITLGGKNNVFTDNIVHDTNYSGTSFAGVYALESSALEISNNTIIDSGRIHIYFVINSNFENCVIKNNYMKNHSCLTSDCGAFYAWNCNGGGTEIYNNFVDGTTKNTNGTLSKYYDGLYLDNYCSNFIVHHNIVVGGTTGLRTNLTNHNTLYANNTVIGSTYGYGIYGYPIDNADASTIGFYNNLFVNIKSAAVNYFATENGEAKSYIGPLVNGKVPVTINDEGRMQSSNNLQVPYLGENYQPRENSPAIDGGIVLEGITKGYLGSAPDIGAIEAGGEVFSYGASWALE